MPDQAMTNWTITAPSYEEFVDIVPPYTAARPVTDLPAYSSVPSYTARPVYIDSPTYIEPMVWSSQVPLAVR
jgi:hypothetical protein